MSFLWIIVETSAVLILFCLLYGFVSGAFLSLTLTVTVALCPTLDSIWVRMGMMFGATVFGLLIGNPIAGVLVIRNWLELRVFLEEVWRWRRLCFVAVKVVKDGVALRDWS